MITAITVSPRRPRTDCPCVCVLTVDVLLVSLQALDDPGVSLQAALPQLVQVVHHVVVRLKHRFRCVR